MTEEENVQYSFTGDVSSLRKATEEAIGLLNKYSNSFKTTASAGNFGASDRSAKSMGSALKGLYKDLENLQKKMRDVSDVSMNSNGSVASGVNKLVQGLKDQYKRYREALDASLKSTDSPFKGPDKLLSTKDVNSFAAQIRATRKDLDSLGAGIDATISREQKFQNAVNTAALRVSNFRNTLDTIKSRVTGVFEPLNTKVKSLSTVFDPINSKLKSLGARASEAFQRFNIFSSAVAQAFKRTSQSADSADGATKKIVASSSFFKDILQKLISKMHKETEEIQEEKDQLNKKNQTLKESTKNHTKLSEVLTRIGSLFNRETQSAKSLGSAFGSVTKLFSHLVDIPISEWLSQSISKSIQYVENLNLFKIALGESAEAGFKFVDTMSELYGMDPSNLYRYTGYFYQLTDAIGMADEASSVLSLSLTKAANDIASLFNVDIETVVDNLASGMQGMARAVRKYGIDIRSTTLQQTALSYGITEQVSAMSEADRQALRFLTMMDQVKNATHQVVDETEQASGVMGDFARNIETPANQLRIFKEQISQLGRAIGNFFIPILRKLLPLINGVVMALRTVLGLLATLIGIDLDFGGSATGAAEQAKALTGIGDAAGGASKSLKDLKKTLAPFDEINLLSAPNEDTGGGGGGGGALEGTLNPALEEAIKSMSLSLEDIQMKAVKVRDSLLEFFGFNYVEVFNPETGEFEKKLQWFADQFKSNLIDKFPQWEQTINALFDNWPGIIEGISELFRSLGDVVDSVKTKIADFKDSLGLDDTISKKIEELPEKLNNISSWISEHSDQIADFILILGGLLTAFSVFNKINGFLKPLITLGKTLAPVVSTLTSFLGPILLIAGAFALLYTNSESFAESFKGLFQTIVDSFGPIVESIEVLIDRVWESLKSTWEEHLQPMLESTGDALATVLDVLSPMWEAVSEILQSTMDLLGTLWEVFVAPILNSISDAIKALMDVLGALWKQAVQPIFENVFSQLPGLFDSVIKPFVEHCGAIIAGLVELILSLWTNVLAPMLMWVVNTMGPSIRNIISGVWDIVIAAIRAIMKVINGLLEILRGIIDFLVGVFTGDWKRAWEGLKEIAAGIINSLAGIIEAIINAVIAVINLAINGIWSLAQAFVNSILTTINSVASALGYTINLQWGSPPPQIGYIDIPTVAFASGGVVTGPTNALIGEGRYDEAVIPLGNSPQMNDFADKIAGKINTQEQTSLLREQNQLLRQILEKSGDSVGIRDLSKAITRVQRQEMRAGGY